MQCPLVHCSVALIDAAFVRLFFGAENGVSLVHVRTAFSMIGKFGITAAFAIIHLYTPEVFPTTIRFLPTCQLCLKNVPDTFDCNLNNPIIKF